MTRRIGYVACLLALTGCAVVWGQPYKVEFVSSSSITINFDPALTSMGEVQSVAQRHCDGFGKDALPRLPSTAARSPRCIHESNSARNAIKQGFNFRP
jgi:hypothetical protein